MPRNLVEGIDPDGYWWRLRKRIMAWPDDSDVSDVDASAERHIRTWITAAYMAGAADQFRTSTRMSPHIAEFIRMVVLLYGEDYYDAFTTGLRAADQAQSVYAPAGDQTRSGTSESQVADSDNDLSAL